MQNFSLALGAWISYNSKICLTKESENKPFDFPLLPTSDWILIFGIKMWLHALLQPLNNKVEANLRSSMAHSCLEVLFCLIHVLLLT